MFSITTPLIKELLNREEQTSFKFLICHWANFLILTRKIKIKELPLRGPKLIPIMSHEHDLLLMSNLNEKYECFVNSDIF